MLRSLKLCLEGVRRKIVPSARRIRIKPARKVSATHRGFRQQAEGATRGLPRRDEKSTRGEGRQFHPKQGRPLHLGLPSTSRTGRHHHQPPLRLSGGRRGFTLVGVRIDPTPARCDADMNTIPVSTPRASGRHVLLHYPGAPAEVGRIRPNRRHRGPARGMVEFLILPQGATR